VSPFVAGTVSTFYIQTRDFYSNNVIDMFAAQVTDQYIELLDDSHSSILTGIIGDDVGNPGVYQVQFNPTVAGTFSLFLTLNGLPVD
jgi:hypothetical protein